MHSAEALGDDPGVCVRERDKDTHQCFGQRRTLTAIHARWKRTRCGPTRQQHVAPIQTHVMCTLCSRYYAPQERCSQYCGARSTLFGW
eukprot:209258-Rhodomonas_salina.1